jgi:hypothetical protein
MDLRGPDSGAVECLGLTFDSEEARRKHFSAGFKDAYDRGDYASIVAVAEKLPDAVLQEDEKLLMYYDVAQMRTGG